MCEKRIFLLHSNTIDIAIQYRKRNMRRRFTTHVCTYSCDKQASARHFRDASRGDPADSRNVRRKDRASSCPIYIVQLCFLARVRRVLRNGSSPGAAMEPIIKSVTRGRDYRRVSRHRGRFCYVRHTWPSSALTMLFAPHLSYPRYVHA